MTKEGLKEAHVLGPVWHYYPQRLLVRAGLPNAQISQQSQNQNQKQTNHGWLVIIALLEGTIVWPVATMWMEVLWQFWKMKHCPMQLIHKIYVQQF